ncbi:UNVERIFIED_CONTAM: hypothetical protein PYX00_003029 [Menopon gallinae]|uniref:General transcription factor IIH subunit 3 n=1 Tax=Menopon gallinae TaxID=328185 RepID=A0AAW2HZS5_9NEOP
MSEEIESSLLVVILDTNPSQRIYREKHQVLTHTLESVIAFSNSHLMLDSKNKLAVLACHAKNTEFLFSYKDENLENIRQQDGQYELFTQVERCIRTNLQKLIKKENALIKDIGHCDSLIAGAIAMALCYIHRIQRELSIGEKMNARILIITGSGETASQYMNYMNVFFTAQKQNILIDVCSLDQDLSLLQQGCDITGGIYLKIPQLSGLVQYLLWVFLPDAPLRGCLVLPPPVKVDYRAACFCHRDLIDIGFVCSVCLSIFCKFSPICTTCHTVFQTPGPLPLKPKKKKMKYM